MVGGLVEHQAVHALGREAGQDRPGAFPGRQRRRAAGSRGRRRGRTWPAATVPRRWCSAGGGEERVEQRCGRRRTRRGPGPSPRPRRSRPSHRSPDDEREPSEQRQQQRRLARAVRPHDRDPLAPPDLEVDRAERERSRAARPRRAGASPRRRCAARSRPGSAGPTPPTASRPTSSRSIAVAVARALAACFSDVATRKWRMNLSCSDVSFFAAARALHRPLTLRARALFEPAALGAVRGVVLLRVPAGGGARCRGSRASRRRTRCPSGCARRARARGVTVRSRNARSWLTSDHAARQVVDERLEPIEAGEVEVVGRLVEQEHVEPTQQDRGQRRAGGLDRPTARGIGASSRSRRRDRGRRTRPGRVRRGRDHRPRGRRRARPRTRRPRVVGARPRARSRRVPAPPRRRSRRCGGRGTRARVSSRRSGSCAQVADRSVGRRRGDRAAVGPFDARRAARSSVVLPTPLGPTTPRRVRGPTDTSTPSSTVCGAVVAREVAGDEREGGDGTERTACGSQGSRGGRRAVWDRPATCGPRYRPGRAGPPDFPTYASYPRW